MADLIPMLMAAAGATPPGPSGPRGEAIFSNTASSISWVVPANVTSVSVVCIGGGGGGMLSSSGGSGGGGGDLRYYNNLSVTSGETLTITAGANGTASATPTAGGFSRVARSATTLLEAAGGGAGSISGSGAKNGTSTATGGSVGGGNGGTVANGGLNDAGGAGGAGGYSGNGGDGATTSASSGSNGAGGGGGGGGASESSGSGGAGGGVNVFGEYTNGQGGVSDPGAIYLEAGSGTGGSYGDASCLTNQIPEQNGTRGSTFTSPFGGGGCGADSTTAGTAGPGGQGVVRIVFPGTSRSFPSTDVWMSNVLTTVIETQSSTSSITIPASAQAGDLAVLLNTTDNVTTQSNPSGWTRIVNQEAGDPILTMWYRILQSGDAGTSVTVTAGTLVQSVEMILFRKASGTVSSVNVTGTAITRSNTVIASQTKNATGATAPFIVLAGYASWGGYTMGSADMYFFGGIAGTSNREPSAVFMGDNGDATRSGFMRFRIYDEAPSANVVVTNSRDSSVQTMGSCIIEVT
jgi:hypothetical protein